MAHLLSLYPSYFLSFFHLFIPLSFGSVSLIIFQLAVLICHIDAFHRNARDQMFAPFCTVCYTHLSTWVLLCSPKPTAVARQVQLSERAPSSAERVLFSVLWRQCIKGGMGQSDRDDLSQCVSPQTRDCRGEGHKTMALFWFLWLPFTI